MKLLPIRAIYLFLTLIPLVLAARKKPEIIERTPFPGRPDALFYFEDSEVILTINQDSQTLYTSRNGGKDWKKASGISQGDANRIYPHPRDNQVAIVLGENTRHWITEDQAKSWRQFESPLPPDFYNAISFHYDDTSKILFHSPHFLFSPVGETFYTDDAFRTINVLHNRRRFCNWVKSTDNFSTGNDKADANRIICIVQSPNSDKERDYKLVTTDDYFDTTPHEPKVFNERTVSGMVNMAAVQGFIVVAAKAVGSQELVLYVTKDAKAWHRAIFGEHRIEQDSYTILESTNYSIQVQVTPNRDANSGVLFSSNSNGTYFSKLWDHVNRDEYGFMDFEKIQNIQGIFIINAIDNWEEYQKNPNKVSKNLQSKITFDDGRTFENLDANGDTLNLHSVTDRMNLGRVFSSPAPGIVLGNGNTGKFLTSIQDSNVFVSEDAGKSWLQTSLRGPHKYEFGDQGAVLLAVSADYTSTISYSLNHGKDWKEVDLGTKVAPYELTTIPDSTSLKFTLSAFDKNDKWYVFSIDFAGLHKRKCKSGDFEDWYARKDDKGNPACLMGHTQHFRRRKADVVCSVGKEFNEALPVSEACECSDSDFECDYNYQRRNGECVLIGRLLDPEGKCRNRQDKFKGSSGWRLIPGNDCKRPRDGQKDDLVQHSCADVLGDPASGEISKTFTTFRGKTINSIHYMERDSKTTGTDETVLTLIDQKAWKSHNHGKTWESAIDEDDEIVAIYRHSYNSDYVYFITLSRTVYYSEDRAKTIHRFTAPDIPNSKGLPVLNFHQTRPDWILWTGNQNCLRNDPKYCHTTAHVSKKNGADSSWNLLQDYVKRCQFMFRENGASKEDLIFCEHWKAENVGGQLELLKSENGFDTKSVIFEDIADFATMAEFIIVAAKNEDHYLKAFASVDGSVFAHAEFPANFPVEHETAYTVLDSDTNAMFLHVTENGDEDREYGPIMKSNSNGTSYVISLRDVNRNKQGYVDWEKMQGLEGVAVVNIVSNVDEVKSGKSKKIKTVITHDDGATWGYLACPKTSLDGAAFGCDPDNLSARSLHLHGYTERRDSRDTFSSPSAVGLMVGVGNVGESLDIYREGNTFLTKDGGVTWKQVQKGPYVWEYGDQGSIIVLVERETPTSKIVYSTDDGDTWTPYTFDVDGTMMVERITTIPSDSSRNFLLWGIKDGKLTTVNLDFTGLTEAQCFLPDKENFDKDKSDYDLWFPTHPGKREEPDCLFGHQNLYYRKKAASNCYNGPLIDRLHEQKKNCSCTREDFECDYNFERVADGSCQIATGVSPLAAEHVCQDPKRIAYWDITGYRKIPLSTCSGGRELQYGGEPKSCPNHKEEFDKKYGVSGVVIFFAIILPLAVAIAVGYYAWTKWDGKFGKIRLGDTSSTDFSKWLSWPVAIVAGVVAVIGSMPMLASSIWRAIPGTVNRFRGYGNVPTYTSRSSFARGPAGHVAAVDEDDEVGELLGEDSDEEAMV